jgi:hypothetical protein
VELVTLAFAANAVLAYIIWREKPFGVERQVSFVLPREQRLRHLKDRRARQSSTATGGDPTEIVSPMPSPAEHEGLIHSGRNSYRVDNVHHRYEGMVADVEILQPRTCRKVILDLSLQ